MLISPYDVTVDLEAAEMRATWVSVVSLALASGETELN